MDHLIIPPESPLNMMHLHKKTILELSAESWLLLKQHTSIGPKLDLPLLVLNNIVAIGHWASLQGCLDGK
jgi:hypothetical protein